MNNSMLLMRPHFGITALLVVLLLGACTRPTPTPQRAKPPEPTSMLAAPQPSPTSAGYPAYPVPLPTDTPPAYPPAILTLTAQTPTFTPSPTFGSSPTPSPTETPFPTYPPPPTLIPTLDPATLPDQLRAAITLRAEVGLNGHDLQRVTGWEYGMRSGYYCQGPYHWLDNTHLLLYPITGQEEGMGISEYTSPIVIDLNNSQTWLPPTNGQTPACDLPLWSEVLQVLIVTTEQEVVLLKPNGALVQRFAGGVPLYYSSYLSPSGRRLVTGLLWRDLETGQTVDFSGQYDFGKYEGVISNPGWSFGESRLFTCCFYYADAQTGRFTALDFGQLQLPGMDGPIPAPIWVLGDTRVMMAISFYVGEKLGVVPLINPVAQAYEDVRDLIGLSTDQYCGLWGVAPNGERILVSCETSIDLYTQYLVDLRTFITQTLPAGWAFAGWSPDSQFILLTRNYVSETQTNEIALLPVTSGDAYPVAGFTIRTLSPVWSPDGKRLAYLSEDGKSLITLEAASRASHIVLLPQSATSPVWNPYGDSLAVLAADSSLWWIPNPAVDRTEQLTPSLPAVRDVRWSPSGTHLAFVSGTEVYVVAVANAGP